MSIETLGSACRCSELLDLVWGSADDARVAGSAPPYERTAIQAAIDALDRLCIDEYGCHLIEILADTDDARGAQRLRRLTGVTLKCDFAASAPIGSNPTATGALRRWEWEPSVRLGTLSEPNNPNFIVLDQLRSNLPDLIGRSPTWRDLTDHAENESGLFRVLASWVDDRLRGRQSKSLTEYYLGEPGLQVGTIADIVETVFNHAMAPVFAAFIPGAGLVVPLILIGARFGMTRMLAAGDERDNEN